MNNRTIFTRTRISLVVAACLAASSMPAFAADSVQIDKMEKQIRMLEQQLEAMKADVQQTKVDVQKTKSDVQVTQQFQQDTKVKVDKIEAASEAIRGIPNGKGIHMGGAEVTFGGFLASETAYRSRSLQSDISSPFGAMPFATSAQNNRYNQSEFRGTERQSRLSIEAKAHVTPSIVATGYYEMDFLAAPGTANPNQSNSFSPRTRHVYANIDWLDSGFHLLAGQTWSLATLQTEGLDAKHHWTPLTIDAQYVVGFNWTRQWQLRMSQEFGNGLWGALSFENSQTHGVGGTSPSATYTTTIATPGGSLLANGSSPSYNKYPDIVAKLAADTSYGHYEIYDLARNFQSSNATVSANTWTNAIGLGAVIPVVPKVLEVQATYLTGKGIGRYGTTQLADATYDASGALMPLKGTDYLLGVTWNADPKWVVYGNVGQEKIDSNTYVSGATTYGFGDGVSGLANPSGYLKDAKESAAGFWWSFYKGSFGALKLGMQYSHVTLDAFATGPAGTPTSTTDNMFFTSLRYYPF